MSPRPDHDFDPSAQIAAVDLGSNSFHMIIARLEGEEPLRIDRLREPVRLAENLNDSRVIPEPVQKRALDALRRFGERLAGLPAENVRAVGTNALRSAATRPTSWNAPRKPSAIPSTSSPASRKPG